MAGRILIGTSSWADPGFVEEWYPQGMPARERLAWYAERFEAVEVNSTFYAIPDVKTVARWVEVTPKDFVFDVKLHRVLSRHSAGADSLPPELRDKAETTGRGRVKLDDKLQAELIKHTQEAIAPLREAGKLGALLLQLTPAFSPRKRQLAELEPLVEGFAPEEVAIELRHRGWVEEQERLEETLGWYEDVGAIFVCVDAPRGDNFTIMPPVDAVTRSDHAYMRAHGRNLEGYVSGKTVAERFGWEYSDAELEEIAGRARTLADTAAIVNVAFNNNRGADAPTSARRMRELLGQDPGPPPEPAQQRLTA
jgi:uncharacterized protein YecE (DUF72 family)